MKVFGYRMRRLINLRANTRIESRELTLLVEDVELSPDEAAGEAPSPDVDAEFIVDDEGTIRPKYGPNSVPVERWQDYRIRAQDELHAFQMLEAWRAKGETNDG